MYIFSLQAPMGLFREVLRNVDIQGPPSPVDKVPGIKSSHISSLNLKEQNICINSELSLIVEDRVIGASRWWPCFHTGSSSTKPYWCPIRWLNTSLLDLRKITNQLVLAYTSQTPEVDLEILSFMFALLSRLMDCSWIRYQHSTPRVT